jgi:rhodanese-related sulfurtransferase
MGCAVAVSVVLAGVAACGGSDAAGDAGVAEVDLVGPDEFAARMADPDAVVVNVHIPYEGEIAGTDLFVPFDEVDSSEALPADKDQPLLVYCRTGNMSADATAELVEAGYRDVTDLEGGMVAWEEAGRTIETEPR